MRVEFNYLIAVNCRREVRLAALALFFAASHSHSASCGHIDFLVNSDLTLPTCPLTFFFQLMYD